MVPFEDTRHSITFRNTEQEDQPVLSGCPPSCLHFRYPARPSDAPVPCFSLNPLSSSRRAILRPTRSTVTHIAPFSEAVCHSAHIQTRPFGMYSLQLHTDEPDLQSSPIHRQIQTQTQAGWSRTKSTAYGWRQITIPRTHSTQ